MTRSRLLLKSLALVLLVGGGTFGIGALLGKHARAPLLETIVRGGEGPPTVVLLHGFGSSATEWVPFTQTLRLPPKGRFVFPQGPETTAPPLGPVGGRAWWSLDLASYIPKGGALPDLSAASPAGINAAGGRVADLLQEIDGDGPVVLGGFSQGAMVAGQIAFLSQAPLAGLVLLSGTLVNEKLWDSAYAQRRELPVFLAHGRSDAVLPFALAERLHNKMKSAGMAVTWVPFDGGHEIPAEVVVELNRFLERLWAAKP